MTWCLSDVTNIYGEAGLRRRTDVWTDGEVPVVYPDAGPLPTGSQPKGPEMIPTPNSQPAGPARPVAPTPAPMPSPANGPGGSPISEPVPTDPSASMGRFPAPQQLQYGAQPQSPA